MPFPKILPRSSPCQGVGYALRLAGVAFRDPAPLLVKSAPVRSRGRCGLSFLADWSRLMSCSPRLHCWTVCGACKRCRAASTSLKVIGRRCMQRQPRNQTKPVVQPCFHSSNGQLCLASSACPSSPLASRPPGAPPAAVPAAASTSRRPPGLPGPPAPEPVDHGRIARLSPYMHGWYTQTALSCGILKDG